ncbi:MAG: hypothetical protein J0M19_03715 [Sphingomonadales bacterium]|nr:hypothetical protein [Sphingomonadales bacterium]
MPLRLVILVLIFVGLSAVAPPPQFVREQRTVTVNGTPEQWQLVWDGKPRSICGPEDVEMAVTCPCTGFAYGEAGRLSLVRKRNGRVVDRLRLGPYFSELPMDGSDGLAAMQWRPMDPGDFDRAAARANRSFLNAVAKRPGPRVMRMNDYDHDGMATEFLVQVSAGPCGHTEYMLFGVSRAQPRLHPFATVDHPDDPLILPGSAWQALLKGKLPARVTAVPCGDHGSDVRQELVMSADAGAIRVRQDTWSCPDNGTAEKLLVQQTL